MKDNLVKYDYYYIPHDLQQNHHKFSAFGEGALKRTKYIVLENYITELHKVSTALHREVFVRGGVLCNFVWQLVITLKG